MRLLPIVLCATAAVPGTASAASVVVVERPGERIETQDGRLLAHGRRPSVSPGGRWVTFVRTVDPGPNATVELRVIRSAGGPSVRLLGRESQTIPVSWSPDATRLAIGGTRGLRVASAPLGPAMRWTVRTRLATADAAFDSVTPTFSPTGRTIAYVAGYFDTSDLKVVPVGPGRLRTVSRVGDNASGVAWTDAGLTYGAYSGDRYDCCTRQEVVLLRPAGPMAFTAPRPQSPVAALPGARVLIATGDDDGEVVSEPQPVTPAVIDLRTGAATPLVSPFPLRRVVGASLDGHGALVLDRARRALLLPLDGGEPTVLAENAVDVAWSG